MKNDQYNLGLVSVSFRQHSVREILEATKAVGLSCIEWGSDIHAPCNDLERIKEIAAMQNEYGIACSSYGTYFRLGDTPIDELLQYIAAAKILGTDVLRVWCGRKSGSDMSNNERMRFLAICRQAEKIAESNGVTLCMECHRNTFTEIPSDAVWLMRQISSPHFRMYWQPFQWQSFEQNLENAKMLSPYVRHIHVFNWKDEEKLPLSDAVSEWQSYLHELCAPRSLLLEFMPNGMINELERETAALKKIIGEKV